MVRHINLNGQSDQVKAFVLDLGADPDGSIIELDGTPIVRVAPVKRKIDEAQLTAAILARRDESRQLNEDWANVDRQMWDPSSST